MTTTSETVTGSRHGFDFWQGHWRGHNRKLVDTIDPDCTDWVEFEAYCEARTTLAGLGSLDLFVAKDFPGRGHVEGMTVRLYNPDTDTWKIYWVASTYPGDIGVPVEGRFDRNVGRFYCEEELGGRMVRVQFEWTVNSPTSATWRQLFSFDGGETWKLNWQADHTLME
jgi:hypothetical protein